MEPSLQEIESGGGPRKQSRAVPRHDWFRAQPSWPGPLLVTPVTGRRDDADRCRLPVLCHPGRSRRRSAASGQAFQRRGTCGRSRGNCSARSRVLALLRLMCGTNDITRKRHDAIGRVHRTELIMTMTGEPPARCGGCRTQVRLALSGACAASGGLECLHHDEVGRGRLGRQMDEEGGSGHCQRPSQSHPDISTDIVLLALGLCSYEICAP
jgi:hypothetical protein